MHRKGEKNETRTTKSRTKQDKPAGKIKAKVLSSTSPLETPK